MIQQKAVLEYRIDQIEENNKNIIEEENLYNAICQYNQRIAEERVKVNNKWINLFALKSIAELDLIELE